MCLYFVGPDALIGPLGGSFHRKSFAAGDAAYGLRLRYAPPRSIGPLSPDPITGVNPSARQIISGAQNLSGCPQFLPGHWALSSPKLQRLRFHTCAWRCRTNAPGSKHRYLIRPLRGHLPLKGKAGGCHFKAFPFRGRWLAEGQTDEAGGQRSPAGRRGRRPLRQNRKIPPSHRGGCPHPPAPEDASHS